MDSRPAIGFHSTHVYVKSGGEVQVDAPVLNSKPMSALSPFHEWKEEERRRSYRLPDSLCNGAVVVIHRLPDVATSVGEIGHSDEPNERSRCPRYSKG
ncbi:MAG: hypothetical protein JSS39_04920 [Nitrospira sp.]|nr:hypothetical protein [Nitrospira sp.]